MAKNSIPQIPINTPIEDANGYMHPIWIAWVREVYKRIGGMKSNTANDDLQTQINALDARITALGG